MMKKNLLLMLVVLCTMSTLSFSQYINVDFEPAGIGASWTWVTSQNGSDPPLQFVTNPSATGINTSATTAEFTAEVGGQPWALCFADVTPFILDGTNNIIKIMVYKSVISPVHIKLEGSSAPHEISGANTLINQWEELTFDFTPVQGSTYSRIVIIPDFQARTMDNIIYFDNIQMPDGNIAPPAVPTVAAPTPPSNLCALSIFSDAYSNVSGTNFDPNWGQTTDATIVQIAGNNTLQYDNLTYQGTQFGTNQDVSSYDFLHVDFWTDNSTDLGFFLISPGNELEYLLTPLINAGQWVSVDIPLSYFTPPVVLNDVFQFKVDGNGNVWFDNLYFHGGSNANVNLPLAGTPTTITCPTSCDDGPWTYYEDPSNPGEYLFAIEWGTNAASKAGATVTINVDAAPTVVDDGTDATWSMARYWNVTPGAALTSPVNVKFFYDATEEAAIVSAMNNDGRTPEGLDWFKTVGVDFDPTLHVTGPMITGNSIVLTDVNTAGATENGVLYAQFNGITSFSGGTATTGVEGVTAPVNLVYFRGKFMNEAVELSWATSSETNNAYFEIERSNNGRDFETIDKVEGFNNSNITRSYTSLDLNPMNGNNYYRLKQMDFNGSFEYSDIVFVKSENNGVIRVYPVPFNNRLTIDYTSSSSESTNVMLSNTLGKTIVLKEIMAIQGRNLIEIDLDNQPSGTYILTLQTESEKLMRKIVKQ